jgi:hypothetical protein
VGENWDNWLKLVGSLLEVQLGEGSDSFLWLKSKTFSVSSMYNKVMIEQGGPSDVSLWKIKVPLKIKIFLWYLRQGVVLTKDNLAKRQWKGGTDCCFCGKQESIQHLFFECHVASLVWNVVSICFDISKPTSVNDLLGEWIGSFPPKQRNNVWIGIAAFCWAIWLCRNDVVFLRSKPNSCLQVIFRSAYWIRSWAILSKEKERECLNEGCRALEVLALEIFSKYGWTAVRRINN